ncbi:TPA: type II-A CRISPR-associated protein Csn2 [Streptococcus agalactiae]|nr:type II-A CRISPR-associated protein Csn2 [Streptococcus agalactiae]
MIKINFPILDEPLVLSNATILTIEDVSVYSSLVKHFYQYDVDEHLKLFDDKQKSLKATELMLVTDILEYDEITILELIKALGVKIETQSDTIFEKCFEIIQVYHYLTKKNLLVFVNSGAYLTKDEVIKLCEYINLMQKSVLFLEPRRLYDLPQYVIDKDYFLIGENMV